MAVLLGGQVLAQGTTSSPSTSSPDVAAKQWSFSVTADGYVVPHGRSYVAPTFTADHGWLHLEARYNYEALETGSAWAGYNLSVGQKLVWEFTPMIGGVFGNITGIAPGYETSLSYKRFSLSTQGEYLFDTADRSGNFFYSWSELTYSPVGWIRTGLAAQRTKAYHTGLELQRGLLVGVSHKQVEFTTYIFNLGWTDPTLVFEVGVSF